MKKRSQEPHVMPGANLVVISEKSLDKLKMLVLLPPQIEYLRTQYVMTADDQKNKSREFVFRDNPEVRKLLGMKDEPGEYLD